MPTDSPRVIATISPQLLERVHELAKREDRSAASIVRRALDAYLGDDPGKLVERPQTVEAPE